MYAHIYIYILHVYIYICRYRCIYIYIYIYLYTYLGVQMMMLVEKNYYLNKSARDAYRSYLLSYASHSHKDIFNVHELDLQGGHIYIYIYTYICMKVHGFINIYI
jgi:hypothetical protein